MTGLKEEATDDDDEDEDKDELERALAGTLAWWWEAGTAVVMDVGGGRTGEITLQTLEADSGVTGSVIGWYVDGAENLEGMDGTGFLLRWDLDLFSLVLLDLASGVIMMVLGTRLIKADRFCLKREYSCSSEEVKISGPAVNSGKGGSRTLGLVIIWTVKNLFAEATLVAVTTMLLQHVPLTLESLLKLKITADSTLVETNILEGR